MWIFTVHGFYSIACAQDANSPINKQTLMVRSRRKDHLVNLQKRFSVLAKREIATTLGTDYRYRLIVPKAVWIEVLSELAAEQTWSNFKEQVSRHQGEVGIDYVNALHDVWSTMLELQSRD